VSTSIAKASLVKLQQHRIVSALKYTAKRLAIARCDGTGFALA
jgi:hypothetical protein